MTTGLGFDAFGTDCPAGMWEPTAGTARAQSGPGLTIGGCVSSIKIHGSNEDFEFDAYGNEKSMSDTGQRVWMCLKTRYGTRANFRNFGLELPKYISSSTETEVKEAVRQALLPLIDDGSITLQDVQTTTSGNSAIVVVYWQDNRTREHVDITLPLRL